MTTEIAGSAARSLWSRVWEASPLSRRVFPSAKTPYSFLDLVTLLNGVAQESMALPMQEFVRALNRTKGQILARHRSQIEEQREAAILLVKITNLLITKYEYQHRRIKKFAKPIGFMLDPFNACQLGCPTCQNSSNTEYVRRIYKPIPMATMKHDIFTRFIDDVGATAFIGHFCNSHEPLLNSMFRRDGSVHRAPASRRRRQPSAFASPTRRSLPRPDAGWRGWS